MSRSSRAGTSLVSGMSAVVYGHGEAVDGSIDQISRRKGRISVHGVGDAASTPVRVRTAGGRLDENKVLLGPT